MESLNIHYLPCKNRRHHSMPLTSVCTDDECSEQTLICEMCKNEKHNHKTMFFKDWVQEVYQRRHDLTLQNELGQTQQTIKKTRTQLLKILNQTKKNIDQIFTKVEEKINQKAQLWELHINYETGKFKEKYMSWMYRQTEDIEVLTNQIEGALKQYHDYHGVRKSFIANLENFRANTQFLMKSFDRTTDNLSVAISALNRYSEQPTYEKTDFNFKIQQDIDNFKEISSLKKVLSNRLQWSHKYKNEDISILGNLATRNNAEKQLDSVCVIADYPLRDGQKWRIQIKNLVGSISIGICLKRKVITSKYTNEDQPGNYLILPNGDIRENGKIKCNLSKKFSAKDIIDVWFRPQERKLKFYLGDKKISQMTVQEQQRDVYVPCVYLWKKKDSVNLF